MRYDRAASIRRIRPGAGVGTGFRRDALEKLAAAFQNRIFDPEALTEDYANGLRMFRLGCRQAFVPLFRSRRAKDFVATREYFPKTWRSAFRQRSRWVTGIALQGWEQFGWGATASEIYWLWRDRKGLIGNLLNLAAGLIFWLRPRHCDMDARSARRGASGSRHTCASSLAIRDPHVVLGARVRIRLRARRASTRSLRKCAELRGHAPCAARLRSGASSRRAAALAQNRARLSGARGADRAQAASGRDTRRLRTTDGRGARVRARHASPGNPARRASSKHRASHADEVYDALSFQQGLPRARIEMEGVPPQIARALPERTAREWKVLPFQVADGSLFLAGPEIPSEDMNRALRGFTALELKFHLVTPAESKR